MLSSSSSQPRSLRLGSPTERTLRVPAVDDSTAASVEHGSARVIDDGLAAEVRSVAALLTASGATHRNACSF
jgi:hypothetical protein